MDCEQARNLFDAYLDGELSPALETELDAHRLNCPSCRQDLALMEVAGHVIQSGAGEPPLGAEFTQRLLACLEPVVRRPRYRRRWIMRIGGGLAAAACLTFLISYLTGPEPRVADYREVAEGTSQPPSAVDQPLDAAGCPAFEAAAVTVQQTFEEAVTGTHESSTSLVRFVQMTVLEMIDALELEELREPDSEDIRTDSGSADDDSDEVNEDAGDVEDI
ncbi:MAG: anti-sigma factor family protein [Planctomycetota bacterium]|jgi:anti-sigma factor RsiW